MTLTVSLVRRPDATLTVDYETEDGTAKAGEDYEATEGTLTFLTTSRARTIDVQTLTDDVRDENETFG